MSYTLESWDPDVDFDAWYTDATGERIRARLDSLRVRTVLEIGCATGRMTAQLYPGRDRRVLAMDLDAGMLARAQARGLPDVDWIQGDVVNLRPEDERLRPFQAILCCSVLHEVESPSQILWAARALLAARGVIFVTVPSASSLHFEGHPHVGARGQSYGVRRLWTLDEWARQLTNGTGLEVAYAGEMMAKPWPNERMATLDPHLLAFLASYRGPGGALCFFELEAR